LSPGTTSARWVASRTTSFTGDISIDTIAITQGTTVPATGAPTPRPVCSVAAIPTAFFSVSAAVPIMSCNGGAGPTTATEGTCYTTTSGTCFTDGPGNHGNSERCTIDVLRSGFLSVSGTIALETFFDYFTLGTSTTRLQTNAQINNLAITAGTAITWFSDASVTNAGFVICATANAAPTTTCSTPAISTAYFSVSAAVPVMSCTGGAGPTTATEGTCYTTTSGTCFTDGPGDHGNSERCTINVLRSGFLSVSGTIALETFFDYFTLGTSTTRLQTNAQINNLAITTGTSIAWFSDASVTNAGFTICASANAAPTPTCSTPAIATAFFSVSAAVPVMSCTGGAGPTTATEGTCYTTTSGTCFTDGPGDHGNSERCTINVLRSGFLSVSGTIALETFFDYFTLGTSTTRLQTNAQINNLAITAGTAITWFSDASVTNAGFTICASASVSPTPTCSTPAISNAFFTVSAAGPVMSCTGGAGPTSPTEGTCYTTTSGTCFTDGPGDHGNNERCTINVLRSGFLSVSGTIALETFFDYFTLGTSPTRLQTNAQINNLAVTAGTSIAWFSDASVANAGFIICASATAAPTVTCSTPAMSNAFFSVSAATPVMTCTGGAGPTSATEGTCYTTTSGTCFTDGPGNHGNNERCTINVLQNGVLTVPGTIALETFYDYFTIGTSTPRLQTNAQINNLPVTAGTSIAWVSDASVNNAGFTICGSRTTTAPSVPAMLPTTRAPNTLSPVPPIITSSPVTAGAAGGSGSSSGGTNLILYIVIIIIVAALVLVGLVLWAKKKGGGAPPEARAAFNNPMYSDASAAAAGTASDPDALYADAEDDNDG
jgi:hypothetical protein